MEFKPGHDDRLVQLDILKTLGNSYFDKILNSMDTPYYPDEAERDMDKIMKQLQIVQGSFQKGMLNNLKVPTTQEFGQETESMEQLIRKCMDQSASLHAEIDKIKKATLFCSTRIETPSQTQ